MVFPTLMVWAYFVALARPTPPTPTLPHDWGRVGVGAGESGDNPFLQAAYMGGKVIQFGFPLLYLGIYDRRSLRLPKRTSEGIGIGLGFGLLVAVGMLMLYRSALDQWLIDLGTASAVRTKIEEFGAGTPARYLLLAVFLSLIHSFMEEYYWRWFVFGRLQPRIGFVSAMMLSSLAFMAHHVVVLGVYLPGRFLEAVVPFSLGIAAGGAVWAWLYHRTGSIYASWLSHILVDAAIMTIGYDLAFVPHT